MKHKHSIAGRTALVTAGPTYEAIDPVRFIGNHSTGKMGFEIAMALAERGCHVNLIAGPTHLKISHPLITRVDVTSSDEMYRACLEYFPVADIMVMAAAVADYKPAKKSNQKIKKMDAVMSIELVKT